MTHTYTISGMTCQRCVVKVKSQLLSTAGVERAEVQLTAPQATITMQHHIALKDLQESIGRAGQYRIQAFNAAMEEKTPASWLKTYQPVLLVFAYIAGITIILPALQGAVTNWMPRFMAAFFLVFSFFKFLDVDSFANSYSKYDVLAKKWPAWGKVYPYVELCLGIAYLTAPMNLAINLLTFTVMLLSTIGVLQTVFNKKQIECACLGTVFKLPMSTLTIIENGLMVGMSVMMLGDTIP